MRPILNELPQTLDETYERILQEIPKSNRAHTHRLLQCLTVAFRPLRVEELAEVLAVEFGATGGIPKLNEDLRWGDQEQAVLSACSSLIAVVWGDDSRVVQFSHFSVKEFLTSDRLATSTIDASNYHHILLEPSHMIMAQACLSVLLRLDSHISEYSLKNFPLARYASEHFGDHAEVGNVFAHLRDGIGDLLDADKPHFAAWLWVRGRSSGNPERPEASPLYHVAGFGFRAMVDHLISKRPEDLNVRGHYGIPLHASLHNGHVDVALLLLGHCVDMDVRGIDDRTPLHMAADRGLLEVTRILIERDASINARDSSGQTALHLTRSAELDAPFDDIYFDVARYLLEHGIDVDAQANTERSTPLHLASYWGGFKVAQLLLDHGADINVRDKDGRTPLHVSVEDLDDVPDDWYFKAIEFLLEHGADVVAQDHDNLTPLHVASASQCDGIKVVRLLLEHGANADALDNEYATPLHIALRRGNVKVPRLLLEHGADVHALDDNHPTALHFASEGGNAEAALLLLEHGADVHALDNNHSTPLHFISQFGGAGAARVLLEHGAVVDARDNKDSTPLHVASQCSNAEVARILLEHGANINARNKEDQTPQPLLLAMWIRRRLDIDTIRFFIERGADVDAIDKNHSTLLHRASYNGNVKVVQLLLEHGANINMRNEGHTPLHRVLAGLDDDCGDYFFDTIQLLLEHGADVDALGDAQSTPLHVASKYGSAKATWLLLEHGANIHLKNNEGYTPSQVASTNGHEEIARLLSEASQKKM